MIAYFYAKGLTIAGIGEEFSVNLGLINSKHRNDLSANHLKKNLPHISLPGVVFLLESDILGRLIIYPYEIPMGFTVGIIGRGIFLYFLIRRRTHAY